MLSPKVVAAFHQQGTISTDTRKIRPGDIFFALKGENFDGNQYAAKALEAGASCAVVSDAGVCVAGDARYLLVPDVLLALQDLAREYRREFKVPVLGITGTNGKTTSKELIHAVMSTERRIHATVGNLNNHIGVPCTLLAMHKEIDFAIIEMGANKPGDIKELAEIAEPTHGLITNIGQAHLERFGNVDGVQKTKGELFDFIRSTQGSAFVNLRDARVRQVAQGIKTVVSYGTPDADYHITDLENHSDHLRLRIAFKKTGQIEAFRSRLIGPHNAENILAAVAVGDTFGISLNGIRRGLEEYVPRLNRTELIDGPGYKVLLDAYNANPSSMEATLRGLQGQQHGRMAFILGDMFELGPESPRFHRELVSLTKALFPNALLVGVGKEMKAAIQHEQHGRAFEDVVAASSEIADLLGNRDFVLVKGSRGMALERLLAPMGIAREGAAH